MILEITIPKTLKDIEKEVLIATLNYTKGNKEETAKLLGIGRKTVYNNINEMNLRINIYGQCIEIK